MFISPIEADEMAYGDLVNFVYEKISTQQKGAVDARVQYVTTEGQSCIWSIELIEHQDIVDLCLFIKGICSVSDEEARIEGISLLDYKSNLERGKTWRENAGSQAQPEKS